LGNSPQSFLKQLWTLDYYGAEGGFLFVYLRIRDAAKRTRKIKNRNFAMEAAAPTARVVKPRTAAMRAMIKNRNAHASIWTDLLTFLQKIR
jgi:hypothetical protein